MYSSPQEPDLGMSVNDPSVERDTATTITDILNMTTLDEAAEL